MEESVISYKQFNKDLIKYIIKVQLKQCLCNIDKKETSFLYENTSCAK